MIMPGNSELDLPPISSRRVTSYAPHGLPPAAAGTSRRATGPAPNGGGPMRLNLGGGADDTDTILSGMAPGAPQPPTTRRGVAKFSDASARPKSSVRSRRVGISAAPGPGGLVRDNSSAGIGLGSLFSNAGGFNGDPSGTLASDTGSNGGLPIGPPQPQMTARGSYGYAMRRATSIDRLHQRFNPNLQQQAPLVPSSLDDFNPPQSGPYFAQSSEIAEETGTDVNSGLRMQVSPVRSHHNDVSDVNAEPRVSSSSQDQENVPPAATARHDQSSLSSPQRHPDHRPPPSSTAAANGERREYLSVAANSVAASSVNKSLGTGTAGSGVVETHRTAGSGVVETNRTAGGAVGQSRVERGSSVANRGSTNTGGSIANSGSPSTLPARTNGKLHTKTVSSPSILPSRISQSTAPMGYTMRTNRNLSGSNVAAAAASGDVSGTVNGETTRRSEAPESVNVPPPGVQKQKSSLFSKSELMLNDRPRAASRLGAAHDTINGALRKEKTTMATRNGLALGGRSGTQAKIAKGKEKENAPGAGAKQVRHVRDYNLLFNQTDDDDDAGAEENGQDGAGNAAAGNDEEAEQQQDPEKRERIIKWLIGLEAPSEQSRSPDFHGAVNGLLHAQHFRSYAPAADGADAAAAGEVIESIHREYDAIPSSPTTPSLRDTAIHIIYDGPNDS